MKDWQFFISTALAFIALLLTVYVIWSSQSTRSLEEDIQKKQLVIAQAQNLQMIRNNMLREMAVVAVKNERMMALLRRHGMNVSVQQNANAPQAPAAAEPAAPVAE